MQLVGAVVEYEVRSSICLSQCGEEGQKPNAAIPLPFLDGTGADCFFFECSRSALGVTVAVNLAMGITTAGCILLA
jgi:hypothetical protein